MWAVVTIPPREAMADELIRSLEGGVLKVLDTGGDVQRSHIRAWREICALGGDWVGVMQDDVIPCAGFAAKARRRLEEADARGWRAVSFYNHAHLDPFLVRHAEGWSQVDLALMPAIRRPAAGSLEICSAVPGEQCLAVRREVAEHYPGFAERHRELYRLFPDVHDALFGLFLNAEISGARDLEAIAANHVHITRPNLVDHRVDVPSSLDHPSPARIRSSSTFRPDAE